MNIKRNHVSMMSKLLVFVLTVSLFAQIFSGTVFGLGDESESGIELVSGGVGQAVVITSVYAEDRTLSAAQTLVNYVFQSTGATFPIMTEADYEADPNLASKARIYVGTTGASGDPDAQDKVDALDNDGFVILPYDDTIIIKGPTAWGTEFGVYEFLERYLGIRWLFPGTDGEDVPQLTALLVPYGDVIQEPAFKSRVFSPINEDGKSSYAVQNLWSERNRMHYRDKFHHNLYKMFPPSKYGTTHPEYYPAVPKDDTVGAGWQPCLTNATAQEAIATINQYFTDHPEETAYSLAINDSGGFCEENPKEIYYHWVNQIVEEVLLVHPGKQFGVLAYQDVKQPPTFALNPNIVVYITRDRWNWINPARKAADLQLHANWEAVASRIGWYDYLNGTPYLLPRIYNHLMADNYELAQDLGVEGQYAELYPNWGEGPKPWISAKLQWNPDLDVDQLTEEWYDRAVGPASAPYLQAYYDHWEAFWTDRVKASPYFAAPSSIRPDYIELVTPDEVGQSREWLEMAVALAQTDKQEARANMLLRAFEYFEASVLSYPQAVDPPANETEALAMLEQAAGKYQERLQMGQKRLDLLTEFKTDPVLIHMSSALSKSTLVWSGYNVSEFWSLVNYMKQHEPSGGPVTDLTAQLSGGFIPSSREYALLLQAAMSLSNLIVNPSFEVGTDQAPPWDVYKTTGTRSFSRIEGTALTGNASLLVEGSGWGGPGQIIAGEGGFANMQVSYKTVSAVVYDRDVIQIGLNLLDENGDLIKKSSVRSEIFPLSAGSGTWATAYLNGEIPEKIGSVLVKKLQPVILVESDHPVEVILDDVKVYNLRSSSVPSGSATVTGTVYSSGHAPLSGATVTVTGTVYDATTDTQGKYTIAGIPPGVHTITVAHAVYDDVVTEEFELAKWEMKSVNVSMTDEVPPVLSSVAAGPVPIGTRIPATSSESGILYLVPGNITPTLANIEAAANVTVGNTVYGTRTSVKAGVAGALNTAAFAAGSYKAYAVDAAGNVSTASAAIEVESPPLPATWTLNPSFESGTSTADPWTLSSNTTLTRTFERVAGTAYSGTASVLVSGTGYGGPAQTFNVQPGDATVKLRYNTALGVTGNANIGIGLYLLDAAGNNVHSTAIKPAQKLLTQSIGAWGEASWDVTIPAKFPGTNTDVKKVRLVVLVYSLTPVSVYVDDVDYISP
ncbi:DUF4838 domain-containing protein [Paenibacillus eucommiae]|uniref:DUF4838 domain-containing protein n=1 Tax=Paenibacillus eucommiae TaxID=1355755 RepID=A0ABS4J3A9_9BACL|nr:DUF4838 domain-containing protein [Paenibacillus eucommiae]MBP1994293.1 hypothetical protein [Paenibacillus eucommiae]